MSRCAPALFLCVLACCPAGAFGGIEAAEWPMLAHDARRSGATPAEIRPPFERKWYRLFADEGLMAGVQPVVAGGKVFVGTLHGVLHAIDAETGRDAWTFRAGGAILHTCAAAGGKVFFGCADGKVYAIGAADGAKAWELATPLAVWNAPAVHEGVVLIGGRDGSLYALEAATGKCRWTAATGGPLLSSPAVDAPAGRVVVGSEDMHVYAFGLGDGRRRWRSQKLPGVSFRGYHPVIAPDGSVMITVQPARSLDDFNPLLSDMVKEIFGDMASWRHTKEENARLRAANLKLLAEPGTYDRELAYLRKRLTDEPQRQTFFVLDGQTGRQRFVAPIVYGESMNGTSAPPVVTPGGKVIVKYRVLLRSRYGAYSPFLNVGYLDTAGGHITPVMDQSRTYGWHDSLLLVHDEQCQLSVAGRVLINAHQDNVNAMDLQTLQGYGEPFCHNIHEPAPGEAVGIWAHVLAGRPVPVGKEWLSRGTAVYGGGSVLDVPVSVAGDSFYYVPAHEIHAGAAVVAYRMQPGGKAHRRAKPPADKLTDEQWKKVQQLPWDWDMLGMPRLNKLLPSLPGKVPGTRLEPLTEHAAAAVAAIRDADLDRLLAEAPEIRFAGGAPPAALREKLRHSVEELISRPWRPLVFPAGKHPTEAYRFFGEPTETLYTLARAYPYLGGDLQGRVRQHVAKMRAKGGPLDGAVGQRTSPPDDGEVRCRYDVPAELARRAGYDIVRSGAARLYPLWLWAHATGDWSKVEADWAQMRGLLAQAPNRMEEDCRNGHVAGLLAAWRMAKHVKDDAAAGQIQAAARTAMRDRLAYELAHPRGGLIFPVAQGRSILARWRHLTPEVGRLLAAHAGPIHRHLMSVYVDHHRPTWWLAWNVETLWRNEAPMELPTMSAEVFAARAWILREAGRKLQRFLDMPWCKADLFYIQKLVLCIEACGECSWRQPGER
jgi:hypothetical protein